MPEALTTPRRLLERFQQAMLDFSPDALADLFDEDAVYEFPFLAPQRESSRYEGREQIRAGFLRSWGNARQSPLTGFHDVRVHETTDPEVIIAEHELDAVDPVSGEPFRVCFLLVLRVRDGKIVHARDYADALGVAAGFGRLTELLDQLRTERPAYALSEVSLKNNAATDRYRALAAESITRHGGRYLVRGGPVEAVEGEWPEGTTVVLVEFPSRERMRAWYESADYAPALALRDDALERRLVFVGGANG